MQVTREDVIFVADLVNELCGVVLDESKAYLIESRLSVLAKEAGCASYTELCRKARLTSGHLLQTQIINAITTGETLFFRDASPFEALRHKVLPELIDVKAKTAWPKRLRIWSAAASSGQEAYSIAMTLCELIPNIHSWDIAILGTDVSDAAVKQASMGRFSRNEIQRGMPLPLLNKYFIEEPNGWKVRDEIRSLVSFQRRNLLDSLTDLGPFDVVFCRNVAIYFSPDVRRDLFRRVSDRMTTDGYLFVGSSESLTDMGARFTPHHHCRAIFYRPNLPTAKPSVPTAPLMRAR
jgi:chemotaxis protein methyltransferase CheR